MKLSTNLIKANKTASWGVQNWNPDEIHGNTIEEITNLHMLAEGVTNKAEWIIHDVGAVEDSRPSQRKEATLEDIATDDLLKALIKKKATSHSSRAVFKAHEVPVDLFRWPTVEELLPTMEEPALEIFQFKEITPQIDLEEVQRHADNILLEARQDADQARKDIIAQAQQQAETILQQAKSQVEEMINLAEKQKEEISHKAYQEGLDQAKEEATVFLETARKLVQETQDWHEHTLARAEEDVLNIIRAIAQNLFGSGRILDQETLSSTFSKSLDEAKSLGNLRLRIHPADATVLGALWAEQQSTLRGIKVEIIPNETILRGGCVIESDLGTLNGRVDHKLNLVMAKINEVQSIPADQETEVELSENDIVRQSIAKQKPDQTQETDENTVLPEEPASVIEENSTNDDGVIDLSDFSSSDEEDSEAGGQM